MKINTTKNGKQSNKKIINLNVHVSKRIPSISKLSVLQMYESRKLISGFYNYLLALKKCNLL